MTQMKIVMKHLIIVLLLCLYACMHKLKELLQTVTFTANTLYSRLWYALPIRFDRPEQE